MAGPHKVRAGKVGDGSKHILQQQDKKEEADRSSPSSVTRSTPSDIRGLDGNRDPSGPARPGQTTEFRTRVEGIGIAGYDVAHQTSTNACIRPTKPCSLGRGISLKLNTFHVTGLPTAKVFQHDVEVDYVKPPVSKTGRRTEPPNRAVMGKVWRSKAVTKELGQGWIYDGNKLAWSLRLSTAENKSISIEVDLDAEDGKPASLRNTFKIKITNTKTLDFSLLSGWLGGKTDFSDKILEQFSFLDHLIREYPSQKHDIVRKSFFSKDGQRTELGRDSGVMAAKGVFASIRPVQGGPSGPTLSINVDLANVTFYQSGSLMALVGKFMKCRDKPAIINEFDKVREKIGDKEGRDANTIFKRSPIHAELKRLSRVRVYLTHLPKNSNGLHPVKTIQEITWMTAGEHFFNEEKKDATGNVISSKKVNVLQYFDQKYKFRADRFLPLIMLTGQKGTVVPMDVCTVVPGQRYPFKLSPSETESMIKLAVTYPPERWGSIEAGLKLLDWGSDPYIRNYGLTIDKSPAQVSGRYLDRPTIYFREMAKWDKAVKAAVTKAATRSDANPKDRISGRPVDNGRWGLQGVQFQRGNTQPLVRWGVCVVGMNGRAYVDEPSTRRFVQAFCQAYRNHGGIVGNTEPVIKQIDSSTGGEMISTMWNAVGNKHSAAPQLLVFILPGKIADLYKRIKKSCDCRYGVVSQCLQATQVQKCDGQYISNVLLKVNAKLGGTTCRAVGTVIPKLNPKAASLPTVIVGADVSHAAPGLTQGSLAAMTMSMDSSFMQYFSRAQTNGIRVEMITADNIQSMLRPMLMDWMHVNGGKVPSRFLYLRDGVAEGQYRQVLEQELPEMRALIKDIAPKADICFTVVIAAKRHHIRFFPGKDGDRNENPKPGTLIEQGATHPYEFDWYMCSHSAIKGTARPIHYYVLANDKFKDGTVGFAPEELQQMIFEHSFQYARSTTPVSQHPAIFYAHLTSKRAEAHLNEPAPSSGKKGDKADKPTTTSSKDDTEVPPLLPMPKDLNIQRSMWYI